MSKNSSIRKSFWAYFNKYWPMITWISICVGLFTYTYISFKTRPQYYYLRSILGMWLCISRGTAPVITMCSLLVLVPVCRSLHTMLHRLLAGISTTILASWLSKIKHIHIVCAITLIGFSLVHTGAHVMNAVNFSRHYSYLYPEINVAKYKGENPALLICTWTGCSGILMLLLLLLMAATSTTNFRKKHFNSFYIAHHSFTVYLLLLLTHPLRGILKEQYNVDKHVPGCTHHDNKTFDKYFDTKICKDPPQFKCISTKNWILVSLAIIIYLIELLFRKYKNNRVEVRQLCVIPGKAVHLRIKLPKNFHIDPGQYVLLQCNQISIIEWHPFTVTKCPLLEEESFDLLISVRGDWTEALYKLALQPFSFDTTSNYLLKMQHPPVCLSIDGPFSSPMQSIKNTKYSVCIAAGVGITAHIATIKLLISNDDKSQQLKRLHLIWLVRNPQQILWYSKLFRQVSEHLWLLNCPDKFLFKIHITEKLNRGDVLNMFQDEFIKSRIHIGRPNWKEEFLIWRNIYNKDKVSIFCCGPNKLTNTLKKYCTKSNTKGSSFTLIHEGF